MPVKQATYRRIIIDGSNLVFTKLSRFLSQLKKMFPIDDWKAVDKDILFQTKFIIDNSANDIINVIKRCRARYHAEEIYLVFDPVKTPSYVVNPQMVFGNDELLKDNKYISVILQN